MIEYKLAKKIKDAGFLKEDFVHKEGIYNSPTKEDYYVIQPSFENEPTFSELKKACRGGFISAEKHESEWRVKGIRKSTSSTIYTYGKSLEHATAALWLILNSK